MFNLKLKTMKKIAVILVCVVAFVGFSNAQTKTAVKTADLQKVITDNVAKDYAGFNIQTAYKVEKGSEISYEVNVVKGAEKLVLVYDKDGKFLSKHAIHATAMKTEAKKPANKDANAKAK
jgi:hypothetical protein